MTGARIALPRLWRARPAAARPRGGGRPRRLRRPLVLAGVAALLLAATWYWGRDLSLWSVDDVRVTGATGQDAAQIEAALQSAAHGMTTLHVRNGDLRDAVARFPIVKSLRVHSSFPHGLRIQVVENVPVAALAASGHPVAVAADGTLLRNRPVDGLPLVPVQAVPTGERVTDAQAAGAIALAAAAPAGSRTLIVRVRSGGGHLPRRAHPGAACRGRRLRGCGALRDARDDVRNRRWSGRREHGSQRGRRRHSDPKPREYRGTTVTLSL
jgi:cell division protein FtsQ